MRWLPIVMMFHAALSADSLDDLARDFWAWRAIHQPITSDDSKNKPAACMVPS